MHRTPRLLLAVLSFLALALSACGGDDLSAKSAPEVLKETFGPGKSVKSGKLDLRLSLDATLPGTQGPLKLALRGPFASAGKGKLPKFDFDVTIDAGGQSIAAGAVSTGDRAWLKFANENFAIGGATFKQFRDLYEADQKKAAAAKGDAESLSSLGIDPTRWLASPEKAQDETVAGAETVHVTANLDVPKLLDDVNKLLSRADASGAAAAATGTTGVVPTKLTDAQRRQIEASVKSTSFDVYSGKDDGTLRRLNLQIAFDVPESAQGAAGGLTKGKLGLDLVISELNEEQTITAPERSRPLSDLTQSGATGATGAASGATGTGAPAADPDSPQAKYATCLDKAGASIAEAQRCAPLLGGG